MIACVRFPAALALAFLLAAPARPADDKSAAPAFSPAPPAWVLPPPPEPAAPFETSAARDGEFFELLDTQVNVAAREEYTRVVKRILTETGVQEGSRLLVHYDPDYQSLTLHHVRILRDGNTLERLDPAKVKVIQQETDLERHIYNGSLSALLMLEDVRAGDRLDYAFTLRGANPIFKGRHSDGHSLQFAIPVGRLRLRILFPPDRPLRHRLFAGAAPPAVGSRDGLTEWTWSAENLPACPDDDRLPGWYDAAAWVQVTEYADWREVADWAAALYTVPATLPPELAALAEKWKKEQTPEARLLAALQFVQDEIRYLGLEFGPFTHQPTAPDVVLARRFGDCKDKALLLCTALRALGLEAWPVLVNSDYLAHIGKQLPSPYVFDHLIVQVRLPDGFHWVDPTASHQRGPLKNRWRPDYGLALRVAPGETALTPIPPMPEEAAGTVTVESFRQKRFDEPFTLAITTRARGGDAEEKREMLAQLGRDKMTRQWLNYYAAYFPGIESAGPLVFTEDDDGLRIAESYTIRDLWSLSEDKSSWSASFYPSLIADYLQKPATTLRGAPLGLPYPLSITQETEIALPEEWPTENGRKVIEDEGLRFTREIRARGSFIRIRYNLTAKKDHIPADKVSAHVKMIDRIHDHLGYELTRPNRKQKAPAGGRWVGVLLAAAIGLPVLGILAGVGLYLLLRRR